MLYLSSYFIKLVLYTLGVNTNRDEWVYDIDKSNLDHKMSYFTDIYNQCVEENKEDLSIKWSSSLRSYAKQRLKTSYRKILIQKSLYRPYCKLEHYTEKLFNHRLTSNHYKMHSNTLKSVNKVIAISNVSSSKLFHCLASDTLVDLHLTGDSQCISLYSYDDSENRIDNITDWGLKQFQNYYDDVSITKLDIFHYTYAVLHNPAYREKYELNLKQEFPRIPFYDNFRIWVAWGRQIMDLHINYETIEPYGLKRIDLPAENGTAKSPKVKLKADKDKGTIVLDTDTSLHGVPCEAWEYKLGNRSALEWILDQYKEKKPRDKTIAEKFNTYRFADYKEQVVDLLQRVCTVSVETIKIIEKMKVADK
jgi:predicted helicase